MAEINGGPLVNTASLFQHLEQGLAKSFNKPGIISTHQPANHLSDLIALSEGNEEHQHAKAKASMVNDAHTQKHCLTLSYHQIRTISRCLAAGILENGVQPNSTVLMLIPNGAEFGLLFWTSIILRLTITCVDPDVLAATSPNELQKMLHTLKPSLIAAHDTKTVLEVDRLVNGSRLTRPLLIHLDSSAKKPTWVNLTELMKLGNQSLIDRDEIIEVARSDKPDRVHSILFTSGSSGPPKGCPMRVGNQTHDICSQSWLIDRESCHLALQQAHPSRGIAHLQSLLTWSAGGAVVMTDRGFSVSDIVKVMRQFPLTFLALSPPMVHEISKIIMDASLDTSSVRTVQVGGDAVTNAILAKCTVVFPLAKIVVAHGMTEGGGSFRWPFGRVPTLEIPHFGGLCPVGAVSPGSVVRIWSSEKMELCEREQPGALHIRSGGTIRHYLFGASESSFYEDKQGRWFDTGDIAVVDANGIVYILGRAKDIIKRDGMVIMPAPLQNCIETLTGEQVREISC